ncbi:hypothetical protein HPC49_51395, partial [Pyxidicoccus fallax]|nr:hypothetical protein [Pyxidicoccus fallax]
MKALTLAVTLLTAMTSLAANEPQGAELRRPSPPPGRPMPQPAPQPVPHSNTLVVVDREELNARLARLEKLLEETEQRMDGRGNDGRNKLRKAQETLDAVQQLVAEARPLGTV